MIIVCFTTWDGFIYYRAASETAFGLTGIYQIKPILIIYYINDASLSNSFVMFVSLLLTGFIFHYYFIKREQSMDTVSDLIIVMRQ